MAGIYESGLSCWERRQRGLAQDHAGGGIIDENKKELIGELTTPVVEEIEEETPEVEVDDSAKGKFLDGVKNLGKKGKNK